MPELYHLENSIFQHLYDGDSKNGVFQMIQTRPKTNYKARAWSKMKNYYIFKSKEPQFNGICVKQSTFLPLTRAEKNYSQKIGRNFIFSTFEENFKTKIIENGNEEKLLKLF